MSVDVSQYATLVFDCDGVVLNSNKVKTTAFYNAALPYGESAALALVKHHKKHGGISRYNKFEYFIETIVGEKVEKKNMRKLLDVYAEEVCKGLLLCNVS